MSNRKGPYQDSQSQEDLFDDDDSQVQEPRSPSPPPPRHQREAQEKAADLKAILKELRELRKENQEIKKELSEIKTVLGKKFRVADSQICEQYDAILKEEFATDVWGDEERIKEKCRTLLTEKGYPSTPLIMQECMSYKRNKFTHWRSEVKSKMTTVKKGHSVTTMHINKLNEFLFHKNSVSDSSKRQCLTIRSFCYRNRDDEVEDFWKQYAVYRNDVEDNEEMWKKMEALDEKRVRRAISEL